MFPAWEEVGLLLERLSWHEDRAESGADPAAPQAQPLARSSRGVILRILQATKSPFVPVGVGVAFLSCIVLTVPAPCLEASSNAFSREAGAAP